MISEEEKANRKPKSKGFFVWKPHPFHGWPIELYRGHDEFYRKTIGIITWLGSIFFAWPCVGCRIKPCELCWLLPGAWTSSQEALKHTALTCPHDAWAYGATDDA